MSGSTADLGYGKSELMIAASARQLGGVSNCFVGVGLPNIVCNLTQRTVAPDLVAVGPGTGPTVPRPPPRKPYAHRLTGLRSDPRTQRGGLCRGAQPSTVMQRGFTDHAFERGAECKRGAVPNAACDRRDRGV